MKTNLASHCAILFAVAATGVAVPPTAAQPSSETLEEVVVEAPIERQYVRRSSTGGRIEVIELRRRVNIEDLDLTNPEDVLELDQRIEFAARESCEKLAEMFPRDTPTGELRTCVRRAINSAKDQKERLVATAS